MKHCLIWKLVRMRDRHKSRKETGKDIVLSELSYVLGWCVFVMFLV